MTYRPGYIEGKTKTAFYLDPALHRALKVRAAETGQSMGEIAERALRKELGFVEAKIHVIELGQPGEQYMERVASFTATLSGGDSDMLEESIRLVEGEGYKVVRDEDGGCNEVRRDEDDSVEVCITVEPKGEIEFDWEREELPDWDSSGTIAESWYAMHGHYALRIDHFKPEDGGGWAFTVTVNANPIAGGENEDAESFEDAERRIKTLITG